MPLDLFQEKDVLEEYLGRIHVLGWRSRHQFEETWMFLLSVLNSPPPPDANYDDEAERTKISVGELSQCRSRILFLTTTEMSRCHHGICDSKVGKKVYPVDFRSSFVSDISNTGNLVFLFLNLIISPPLT